MLSLSPSLKIYVANGTTDMRKSFDALAGAVREVLDQDPLSGHLFVFLGRRRHLVKILYWDGSGFWLLAKRLARGTFAWPEPRGDGKAIELRPDELGALLGGVDLKRTTWRSWWRSPASSSPLPSPPTSAPAAG